MSLPLADVHCHLADSRYEGALPAVMQRAAAAGVELLVCCGTGAADWGPVSQIAAAYPSVVPALGVHPWFAAEQHPDWETRLEELLSAMPHAAVGEIGLDKVIEPRDDGLQREVFERQLGLAERYRRPVSIHCRKAWKPLIDILQSSGGVRCGGAVHSWSGPAELVPEMEKLGLSISFSGSLTYPGSKRARGSAAVVHSSRLLVETDSPDIAPFGHTGNINEPSNCGLVLATLAQIRGESPESLAQSTTANARSLYRRN